MREQYEKTGELPPSLASKPVLPYLLKDYLDAYIELDRRRQIGYASGQPLSTTDIIGYGLTHGFRRDMRFFFKVVSRLDDHHLEEEAKKRKAKSKPKGKPSSGRPRK